MTYGQLIHWARQQPNVITEGIEDKNASDIAAKIGLSVKEFNRASDSFLCIRLGKNMEFRVDRAQGHRLELWRALSDEYDSQAAAMLGAKMKLYQSPARASNMDELEAKFNEWEQLGRDLGTQVAHSLSPRSPKA